MEEIEAMMAELAKRHGADGMRAIATLMHDLGSDTLISFADGTYVPCDFIMQMAWASGGEPVNMPFERVPQCGCDPGIGDPPTKKQMLECKMRGGPCSPNHPGGNEAAHADGQKQ